jgi:hypothetical protein
MGTSPDGGGHAPALFGLARFHSLAHSSPMSARIGVACEDIEVGRWLEDWIAATCLVPPTPLTIAVHFSPTPLADDGDIRAPVLQPQVEIRSGPPQGDVSIRWLEGPARARIAAGVHTAEVELGPEALADRERLARPFLVYVLVFLLRRVGWHHVHAATARDPSGRDWLFAGNAESGKSTTAALLSTWGWAVGSDDITYLAKNDGVVDAVAQRERIALRPGGFALLGLSGGTAARGGRKMAFFPEELGGSWAARVTPRILILPRVMGEQTRAELVGQREAFFELAHWSPWAAFEPAFAQEHLDLLGALARQARCYRLTLAPDVFARRDFLMELIP